MALFKVYNTPNEMFNAGPKEGNAYFVRSTGLFYIDVKNDDPDVENAIVKIPISATKLVDSNNKTISVDEITKQLSQASSISSKVAKGSDAEVLADDPTTYCYRAVIGAKMPPLAFYAGEDKIEYAIFQTIKSILVEATSNGDSNIYVTFNGSPSKIIDINFIDFGSMPLTGTESSFACILVNPNTSITQSRTVYKKIVSAADWVKVSNEPELYQTQVLAEEHMCGPVCIATPAAAELNNKRIFIGCPTSFGYTIENSNEGTITVTTETPFDMNLTISGAALANTYIKEFTKIDFKNNSQIIITPQDHCLTGELQVAIYLRDEKTGKYVSSIGYPNFAFGSVSISDNNVVIIQAENASGFDGKIVLLGSTKEVI